MCPRERKREIESKRERESERERERKREIETERERNRGRERDGGGVQVRASKRHAGRRTSGRGSSRAARHVRNVDFPHPFDPISP